MAIAATGVALDSARREHGMAHISCFAGTDGKLLLRTDCGLLSYAVSLRVAVSVGDPLTDSDRRPLAVRAFVEHCRQRGLLPCFYQTDPALRDVYRDAGLRIVKFGEEAVIDVVRFDLRSPRHANARREAGRARRAGLQTGTVRRGDVDAALHHQLADASNGWLAHHGGTEWGFSLGRLDEVVHTESWLTLARDSSGRVHAFCTWLPMGRCGAALDIIRRRPDAAPGAVDICVIAAVEEARRRGLDRVSLGCVPFRDALHDAPEGFALHLLRRALHRRRLAGYRGQTLGHFKDKFATHWESRDIAVAPGLGTLLAPLALLRLHRAEPVQPALSAGELRQPA